MVADTLTWETAAAFRLEQSPAVTCYARNDHLGLAIPYEYQGVDHNYEPDFLVQAGANSVTVPYRANRAVIFDSDLFHETDRIEFKEGYTNRRINITMLYGNRGQG